MSVETAIAGDLCPVRRLLEDSGLPFEDIGSLHMAHFGVIRDESEVVGAVGLEPYQEAGLLRSLVVAPGWRGQGLGSHLTDWAEEHARFVGVHWLYLLTTTAEEFFAMRGYQRLRREDTPAEIRATVEFQSLCPQTAVCMRKALSRFKDVNV